MNKYFIIILLCQVYWFYQISSLSQKILKGNLFHKVNVDIQNTVNGIFKLLQLNKNFTRDTRHRLLLSMHATMKRIAERNYPPYKDIKRACKLYIKKKPKAGLFNLDKLTNILVEERLTPCNIKFNDQMNRTGINLRLSSFEIPDNEEDSFAFLKEYLNNLDVNYSFDSPLQKIKVEFEKNRRRVKANRRLKAWKGLNLTKEATDHMMFRRVFNGKSTKINRFPFLASVHDMDTFICAGSIISQVMIITAASCLQRAYFNKQQNTKNTDGITVRVGSNNTETQGHLCKVSKIFFHPNYNPDTLENNLAILKINNVLKFTDKARRVRRIEYPRMMGNFLNSTGDILLVGWGDTDADSNGKEPLTCSYLELFDIQKCIKIYTSKYVNGMNFCAGFSAQGAGACQRDIGGPAISVNILVGVVSFGPPVCGSPFAPTVFTNIGYHIDWINSVIYESPIKISTTTGVHTERPMEDDTRQHKANLETKHNDIGINEKYPVLRTSQLKKYPKAIQVITYLLNELLSAGQHIDEMMSKNDDGEDRGDLKQGLDKILATFNTKKTLSADKPRDNTKKYADNEGIAASTKGILEMIEVTEVDDSTKTRTNDEHASKSIHNISPYINDNQISSGMNRLNLMLAAMKLYQDLLESKGIEFSEVYSPIQDEPDIELQISKQDNNELRQNIDGKVYNGISVIETSRDFKAVELNKLVENNTKNNRIEQDSFSDMNNVNAVETKYQDSLKASREPDNNTSIVLDDKFNNLDMPDNYETEIDDDGLSIEFSTGFQPNPHFFTITLNETTPTSSVTPNIDLSEKTTYDDKTRKQIASGYVKDDLFYQMQAKIRTLEQKGKLNSTNDHKNIDNTKILDFSPDNFWPVKRSQDASRENIQQNNQVSLDWKHNEESSFDEGDDKRNEPAIKFDDYTTAIANVVKYDHKFINPTTRQTNAREEIESESDDRKDYGSSRRILDYVNIT